MPLLSGDEVRICDLLDLTSPGESGGFSLLSGVATGAEASWKRTGIPGAHAACSRPETFTPPMRVALNGGGIEVLFVLLRASGMEAAAFAAVARDLAMPKALLER